MCFRSGVEPMVQEIEREGTSDSCAPVIGGVRVRVCVTWIDEQALLGRLNAGGSLLSQPCFTSAQRSTRLPARYLL